MTPRILLLSALAGCSGSSPTAPTPSAPAPPPPAAIELVCPASSEVRAMRAQPVNLTYVVPQATGGVAPLAVVCDPAVGAAAPVGDTRITCTATDARQVKATCDFTVRVVAAPVLAIDRVLAIGDSLTFGTVSRTLREIPGDNYAAKLETLLTERYFDQQPRVFNSGVPGERAATTAQRYGDALRQSNAQVLIVLTGANDLGADGARGIPDVIRAMESITRDAQARGVAVILSTLPPQRPGSPKGTSSKEVVDLNGQIFGLCNRYGARCADIYTAMGGDFSPLIGADGLHPTLAGYDRMAEVYFDIIVSAFDRPPVVPPSASTMLR